MIKITILLVDFFFVITFFFIPNSVTYRSMREHWKSSLWIVHYGKINARENSCGVFKILQEAI